MDSDLIVIGITGRARAGKDLAAGFLASLRGCRRIALADGIRSALADLSGPTGEMFKALDPSHNYRRAMQLMGTESRHAAGCPDLWVGLLLTKIHYAAFTSPAAVRRFAIPDIRYPAEVAAIRAVVAGWGGRFAVLKVVRNGAGAGAAPIPESDHSSEAGLGDVPYDRAAMNDSDRYNLAHLAARFFDDVEKGLLPATTEG